MMRNTFTKAERLTNKKIFESIFKSGQSIYVSPFKLIWIETKKDGRMVRWKNGIQTFQPANLPPEESIRTTFQCAAGISVPKKSFGKAVDRNRIKRRIRESYRKNKRLLYEILQKKNLSIALMIIYIEKEELAYKEIEKKMVVSLQKLMAGFEK